MGHRRSKVATLLALAVSVGALVSGCGGSGGSNATAAGGGDAKKYTARISFPSVKFLLFLSDEGGAEAEAKKLGVKALWADGRNDPSAQGPQVETFLVQG